MADYQNQNQNKQKQQQQQQQQQKKPFGPSNPQRPWDDKTNR